MFTLVGYVWAIHAFRFLLLQSLKGVAGDIIILEEAVCQSFALFKTLFLVPTLTRRLHRSLLCAGVLRPGSY